MSPWPDRELSLDLIGRAAAAEVSDRVRYFAHFPMQNWPKTASSTCSTSTVTNDFSYRMERLFHIHRDIFRRYPLLQSRPARSQASRARRRQSRCRAFIAMVLSG